VDRAEEARRTVITHRLIGAWFTCPPEADYAAAICKQFFEIDSVNVVSRGFSEEINFVGTEQHLTIAEYVFAHLLREFRWQWRHKRGRCKKRTQFLFGCYVALMRKLRERFARPAAAAGANELEISWSARRQEYIERVFGKLKTSPIGPKDTSGPRLFGDWKRARY